MIPNSNLHFLRAQLTYDKKISFIMYLIIATLIIDTSLVEISDLIRTQVTFNTILTIFAVIVIISSSGQYLILKISKPITSRRIGTLNLCNLQRIVTLAQYALVGILVLVTLQILVMSYYNTLISLLALAISYTLAMALSGLFSQKFFKWFKSDRNKVVFLYGLSSSALAVNAVFTLALVSVIYTTLPSQVGQQIAGLPRFIVTTSVTGYLNYAYFISSIVSFVLWWGATAMLLRHYSRRIGKLKYWIIISTPLAYFLSQFITSYLHLFATLIISNPTVYGILLTTIFTVSKLTGGILFGVAFWLIGRNLRSSGILSNYMTTSAYGIILLFASNQAIVLISAPYPPFGLATISFMGFSSYLLLGGIYSSAISVSQDVKLRQSMRRLAVEESKLLDSIGTAQMEHEIQNKVTTMTKKHKEAMTEESGVEASLNEDEIQHYISQVMEEIHGKK
jgi:hypothetical protein